MSERALPELHQILLEAATAIHGSATSELLDASTQDPALWTLKLSALIGLWQLTGRLRGGVELRLVSYEKGLLGGLKRGSRPLEWCMRYLLSSDRFVLAGRVGVT